MKLPFNSASLSRTSATAGVVAFTGLSLYVLLQTRPIFWDEIPYLERAQALVGAESFRAWLIENNTMPSGPLHGLMHYALSAGQGALPVPWVRLPNLVLLAGVMALVAASLKRSEAPRVAVFGILAVPMTWIVTGMAISELPAMFGAALATLGAIASDVREDVGWRGRLPGLAMLTGGIVLATTGRQTYLAALPGLAVVAVRSWRNAAAAALAFGIGLVPIAALVVIWGGLVPPKMAFVGGGVKPLHAVLALCLTGVAAIFLAPRFYWAFRRYVLAAIAVALLANFAFDFVHFTTLTSLQRLLGHPAITRWIERIVGLGILSAGAGFVSASAAAIWKCRDRRLTGWALAVFALCGAMAGVTHQFSSRYAAMSLPFLILMLAPWMDVGRWAGVRIVVGGTLGLAALHSYYLYA